MPDRGGVVVRLTGSESPERVYTPKGGVAPWSGAAALWAADRLAVRAASDEEDRDSVIAFARRYSVAGPDISFLVLETPEDYVESRIEPPATLPAELLTATELAAADAADMEKSAASASTPSGPVGRPEKMVGDQVRHARQARRRG